MSHSHVLNIYVRVGGEGVFSENEGGICVLFLSAFAIKPGFNRFLTSSGSEFCVVFCLVGVGVRNYDDNDGICIPPTHPPRSSGQFTWVLPLLLFSQQPCEDG